MMRLRVLAPAALSAEVVELLRSAPAVSSLAVHHGASVRPDGDVITADVAREGTNTLIDQLRAIGVGKEGTISVEPVPTWISQPGLDAEQSSPGSSADAVIWTEVGIRSYAESELNWTYLSFMTLATTLAGIAIILDSQILTIGAMVLGPEFAPIAALGLALVRRRPKLFKLAARTLVSGFLVAIVATSTLTFVGKALGWVTIESLGRRDLTDFIYHPDKWSVVVAIIAAAAGVLSLTSARLGGLSGVFISVTTIPAAGNIALALPFGAWDEVTGSAMQLLINLVAMALAGWFTLALQQFIWQRVKVWKPTHLGRPPIDAQPRP